MTNLDHKWWQKVAGMNRRELLDALVLAEEALLDTQDTLKDLNKAMYDRESVIVAATYQEAGLSMARLGLPRGDRVYVLTESQQSLDKLRGRKLTEEHILMVPGWGRGEFAEKTKEMLKLSGVNWVNCRYAPSPETDRAEGLSNWGRTEAAVVDDMLSTVNSLLTRTLERTAEKPNP